MEGINLQSTFDNPLVEMPSKLDIKHVPITEDSYSERKIFGGKSMHDFENLKSRKRVQPSTPKKGKNASTNLVTPSPESPEESKPSNSKVTSSHSS